MEGSEKKGQEREREREREQKEREKLTKENSWILRMLRYDKVEGNNVH